MRFSTPFILVLICAFGLFSAVPALAEADEPHLVTLMKNYSEAEKIGFAFYRLAHLDPPIEDWIEANPEFDKAGLSVRYYMRYEERQRLQQGFLIYTPYRDTITLRTKTRLRISGEPKTISINFRTTDPQVLFPVKIGKLMVAVLPRGITPDMRYPISESDYTQLLQTLGMQTLSGYNDVMAELVTLPLNTDIINPIEIGDQPLWPMTVTPLTLNLRDKQNKIIWSAQIE